MILQCGFSEPVSFQSYLQEFGWQPTYRIMSDSKADISTDLSLGDD